MIADNHKTVKSVITTHPATGLGTMIPMSPLKTVKNLELSINGGQLIIIHIETNYQYVSINFIDKKIIVEMLDNFPYYD
jgi:hypothetical protein